jgi:hypothetical protein
MMTATTPRHDCSALGTEMPGRGAGRQSKGPTRFVGTEAREAAQSVWHFFWDDFLPVQLAREPFRIDLPVPSSSHEPC